MTDNEKETFTTTDAALVARAIGQGHSNIRGELGPTEVAIATHSLGGRYIAELSSAHVRREADEVYGSGHFDVFDLRRADAEATLELMSAKSGTEVIATKGDDGVWTVSIITQGGYRGHYWDTFMKAKNMTDQVEHPSHYTSHPSGVECIQVTEHMGFNLGNAIKYIWRADLKHDAIEDLRKAKWYIERELMRRGHG